MTALIDDMHAETAFRHFEPRVPLQSPAPMLIDVPSLSPMGSNDVAHEISEGERIRAQRAGAGGPARRR